jgi:TPR repeat protein
MLMPLQKKPIPFFTLLIILLTFLVSSGCSTTPDQQTHDPEAVMKEAHKAFAAEAYEQVFKLVFPLAASGNADAQYTLGYLYYNGLGVEKSEIQAMNWIQRAAVQGHKKALKALK